MSRSRFPERPSASARRKCKIVPQVALVLRPDQILRVSFRRLGRGQRERPPLSRYPSGRGRVAGEKQELRRGRHRHAFPRLRTKRGLRNPSDLGRQQRLGNRKREEFGRVASHRIHRSQHGPQHRKGDRGPYQGVRRLERGGTRDPTVASPRDFNATGVALQVMCILTFLFFYLEKIYDLSRSFGLLLYSFRFLRARAPKRFHIGESPSPSEDSHCK